MKIAVVYISSGYYSTTDIYGDDPISHILPASSWIEIDPSSEDLLIWEKFVNMKNSKTRTGSYALIQAYDAQEVELDITFAKAKEFIEKEKKRKEEELLARQKAKEDKARKKKESAKKQKETELENRKALFQQLKAEFEKSK